MNDRERILESLGLDISDGKCPDWSSLEESLQNEEDRRLLRTLRSLALMGDFYRIRRREVEAAGMAHPGAQAEATDRENPGSCTGAEGPQLRPGDRWEHLEILELVGQGTHGEVYRARDTDLNRDVALKLFRSPPISGGLSASSLLEGERLARIKHPNLVTIHGARNRGGRTGIWMEHLKGPTLKDQVERQGLMSAREAAQTGIDLCGALAAIHRAGLLHRDIKAQNAVREAGGRIVLMDLGSGTELCHPEVCAGDPGSGTPLYMAPEVIHGGQATVRSDIYSLGVLLYYATAGRYPVEAGSLAELIEAHSRHERRHLRDVRPDLPHSFVTVVERATSPDPGSRYSSAGEMEQALAEVVQTGSGRPAPAVSAGAGGRFMRRVAPLGALVIAAAALAFIFGKDALTAGAYSVEASLHRATSSGSEVILPGSRVRTGDRLWLDFRASRDLHVYVLAEDELGEAYLLYPLPEHDMVNPIPKGGPHRLPPDRRGLRYSWGVSSAGGTEHLLIVASPKALTEFEEELRSLPLPREGVSATALRIDPAALESLRGIGALIASDAEVAPAGGASPFDAARRLGTSEEKTRGVWVRQIDLINPGP